LEMRSGRMILFPSAAITHENIPIGEDECRFGVTAYVAAGFWRFLAQGKQTRDEWEIRDPDAAAKHDALAEHRWQVGCGWFKSIAQLKEIWEVSSLFLNGGLSELRMQIPNPYIAPREMPSPAPQSSLPFVYVYSVSEERS